MMFSVFITKADTHTNTYSLTFICAHASINVHLNVLSSVKHVLFLANEYHQSCYFLPNFANTDVIFMFKSTND